MTHPSIGGSTTWVVDEETGLEVSADTLGGKAAGLSALSAGRMPVPSWFCVTSRVFDDIVARSAPDFAAKLDRAAIETDPSRLEECCAELVRRFSVTGLSPEQECSILDAFDRLSGPDGLVAVRSSAVGEDSQPNSFAGQLESYLYVRREFVLDRVVACLASTFSTRALLYRRLKATTPARLRGAAVVQRMVKSRSSGVIFTLDPRGQSADEMIVAAAYGLGEGVVQDRAEVDTYVLHRRRSEVLRRDVAVKHVQVVGDVDGAGGTRLTGVPAGRARLPVLDDRKLFRLQALARDIEALFGGPQDIEWAIDAHDELHILQSRPITTVDRGRARVFDNSNVSENYHGATTPLTYSYVRRYYEDIFTNVARRFGASELEVARHRGVFANLVSFVNGGIYYNLLNVYRCFYVIPGFVYWVDAFEEGVGLEGTPEELVEERRRLEAAVPRSRRIRSWFYIARNLLFLPR